MELFLLVSMALTIVTFLLIVVSEPAAPSIAEHDSDYAPAYVPEESTAEMQQAVLAVLSEPTIIKNQKNQPAQLVM